MAESFVGRLPVLLSRFALRRDFCLPLVALVNPPPLHFLRCVPESAVAPTPHAMTGRTTAAVSLFLDRLLFVFNRRRAPALEPSPSLLS